MGGTLVADTLTFRNALRHKLWQPQKRGINRALFRAHAYGWGQHARTVRERNITHGAVFGCTATFAYANVLLKLLEGEDIKPPDPRNLSLETWGFNFRHDRRPENAV